MRSSRRRSVVVATVYYQLRRDGILCERRESTSFFSTRVYREMLSTMDVKWFNSATSEGGLRGEKRDRQVGLERFATTWNWRVFAWNSS